MNASSRSSRRPDERRTRRVIAWLGSLFAVAGAVVLFRKRPKRHVEDEQSGRGAPGVPPSDGASTSGHETEDMSGGTMMWVLIALGGLVMGSIVLMVLLLDHFQQQRSTGSSLLTAEQTRPLSPPKPNLQVNGLLDMTELRRREDHLLHTYAWIDARHARARIPIERATALMVGHPLDAAP